jgi:HD-like signal output (HDOD) protein
LDASPEVRPFPTAVTRIMAECYNPRASAADFEKIIECDPALCIHLLRMANSPLFGQTRAINSVARAVSVLGITRLKTLAMSVAGASMFAAGSQAQEQRQRLWKLSVGSAIVARQLSKYVSDVEPEEAFLAGVFHDVGKLLFYDAVPEEYAEFDNGTEITSIDEEQHVFGTTHEEVGLKSAHIWKLPEELKAAIGWHHKPNDAPVHASIASTTHFADRFARVWGIGCGSTTDATLVDDFMARHDVPAEVLDSMQARATQEFEETLRTLTS